MTFEADDARAKYRRLRRAHQSGANTADWDPFLCDGALLTELRPLLEEKLSIECGKRLGHFRVQWQLEVEDVFYIFGEMYRSPSFLEYANGVLEGYGTKEKGFSALVEEKGTGKWTLSVAKSALQKVKDKQPKFTRRKDNAVRRSRGKIVHDANSQDGHRVSSSKEFMQAPSTGPPTTQLPSASAISASHGMRFLDRKRRSSATGIDYNRASKKVHLKKPLRNDALGAEKHRGTFDCGDRAATAAGAQDWEQQIVGVPLRADSNTCGPQIPSEAMDGPLNDDYSLFSHEESPIPENLGPSQTSSDGRPSCALSESLDDADVEELIQLTLSTDDHPLAGHGEVSSAPSEMQYNQGLRSVIAESIRAPASMMQPQTDLGTGRSDAPIVHPLRSSEVTQCSTPTERATTQGGSAAYFIEAHDAPTNEDELNALRDAESGRLLLDGEDLDEHGLYSVLVAFNPDPTDWYVARPASEDAPENACHNWTQQRNIVLQVKRDDRWHLVYIDHKEHMCNIYPSTTRAMPTTLSEIESMLQNRGITHETLNFGSRKGISCSVDAQDSGVIATLSAIHLMHALPFTDINVPLWRRRLQSMLNTDSSTSVTLPNPGSGSEGRSIDCQNSSLKELGTFTSVVKKQANNLSDVSKSQDAAQAVVDFIDQTHRAKIPIPESIWRKLDDESVPVRTSSTNRRETLRARCFIQRLLRHCRITYQDVCEHARVEAEGINASLTWPQIKAL